MMRSRTPLPSDLESLIRLAFESNTIGSRARVELERRGVCRFVWDAGHWVLLMDAEAPGKPAKADKATPAPRAPAAPANAPTPPPKPATATAAIPSLRAPPAVAWWIEGIRLGYVEAPKD